MQLYAWKNNNKKTKQNKNKQQQKKPSLYHYKDKKGILICGQVIPSICKTREFWLKAYSF